MSCTRWVYRNAKIYASFFYFVCHESISIHFYESSNDSFRFIIVIERLIYKNQRFREKRRRSFRALSDLICRQTYRLFIHFYLVRTTYLYDRKYNSWNCNQNVIYFHLVAFSCIPTPYGNLFFFFTGSWFIFFTVQITYEAFQSVLNFVLMLC